MATTQINIGGQIVQASSVVVPNNREFRDAWSLADNQITIDMDKARSIHAEALVRKAIEKTEEAEREALRKTMRGQDTSAEDATLAKFKEKRPRQGAKDALDAATTPEELLAITEDDLF